MIRILTDSAADMNGVEGVDIVPLKVQIGTEEYLDGVNLDRDTFYTRLISEKEFPKTSQPAPQDFLAAFEKAKEEQDDLICILLSSALSGTYQSANIAKNIVDYDRIFLIDSLTTTYAARLLTEKAMKMIEQRHTAEEIVQTVETLKSKVKIVASVDTLDYLCKGGRLSAGSAALGNLAKIKPIITVSKEGTVSVIAKKIGMRKTISYITDTLCAASIDTDTPIYLIYTYGTVNVSLLKERLESLNFNVSDPRQIGPAIGAHVGPEAFGIIYLEK